MTLLADGPPGFRVLPERASAVKGRYMRQEMARMSAQWRAVALQTEQFADCIKGHLGKKMIVLRHMRLRTIALSRRGRTWLLAAARIREDTMIAPAQRVGQLRRRFPLKTSSDIYLATRHVQRNNHTGALTERTFGSLKQRELKEESWEWDQCFARGREEEVGVSDSRASVL